MRTFKTISLWLFILLVASCSVVKTSVNNEKTLQQKVESKDFTFYVERCLPTDLLNSSFNSDVVLKIKNNTAYGNLPFHGLLSVNPMDMTSGPISFDGPMKEFTLTQNGAKGWNLLFKVDSAPYIYQVNMEISVNGKAVVKVTSTKRSTMTYYGEVD